MNKPNFIHKEFYKIVKKFKNKTAVVCENKNITYEKLNVLSNQLAKALNSKGVARGDVVAISTEKSIEFIIAFLAVLKSGAGLLYIDPNAPQKRKNHIIKDSKSKIVITQSNLKDNFSCQVELFFVDESNSFQHFDGSNVLNLNHLEDTAYIIYTSGSTGKPKGVVVPHIGIANHASHYISEFDLSDKDIYAQFASYLFDASISEIVMGLLSGGTLNIIADDVISNYRKFENHLNSSKITVITLPPTYLTHLIPENIKYLRLLVTAGSSTSHALVRKWISKVKYVNAYGPSEASVASTTYICNDDPFFYEYNSVPIGKAISNFQLYIRKEDKTIEHISNVEYGIKGELCIGGIGLAKEYINLPGLTKEKFIFLDIENKASKRIYCTGDIVVLNSRGYLEFIGRIDTQVKIRGYRIELEDINKTILNNFQEIKDCYTTVVKNSEKNDSICTYLVFNSEFLENAFRTKLSHLLPSYMMPTYLIYVEEFPLNSSGKIDVKKLPSPFDRINNRNTSVIAQKDRITSTVYNIWCKILKIEDSNLDQSFFHLGGDSLKAIELATYLSEEFNIDFTVNNLFKNETINKIKYLIKTNFFNKRSEVLPKLKKNKKLSKFPLSKQQEVLFFFSQIYPNSTAYNETIVYKIRCNNVPDKELEAYINRIFNKLLQKHDILRTNFIIENGVPIQKVKNVSSFQVQIKHKINTSFSNEKEVEKMCSDFVRPFRLESERLFRVGLFFDKSDESLLLIDMHHLIIDGQSIKEFINDINMIFSDFLIAVEMPKTLPEFSYGDYCIWQNEYARTNSFNDSKKYWYHHIGSSYPILDLPYSYHCQKSTSLESEECVFYLNKSQIKNLKTISRDYSFSTYNILFGIFCVLLSRYTNQNDFVIGCPVVNRKLSSFDKIIGIFVKVLPIKVSIKENLSLIELLSNIKSDFASSLDHQEFDFSSLANEFCLERGISINNLYDVIFVMQQDHDLKIDLGDNISAERIRIKKKNTFVDLLLEVEENKEETILKVLYRKNLFSSYFINELMENYINLLDSFENIAKKRIANINIVCNKQVFNLLSMWKGNVCSFSESESSIASILSLKAEKYPLEVAISDGNLRFSYSEVKKYAELISSKITDKAKYVGVYIDRSAEFILAVLGILFSGRAYVPIDPKYPKERTEYILNDSKIQTLIIQKKYSSIFNQCDQIKLVFVDDILLDSKKLPSRISKSTITRTDNDLAYVIYTSGSTGNPKGVFVKDKAIVNTLLSMQFLFPMEKGDSFLFKTNSVFDVSLTEIFGWFFGVGKIVVLPVNYELDPEALLEQISINKITHINFVPSMLSALCNYIEITKKEVKNNLKYIFVAGEAFDITLAYRVKKIFKDACVVNAYGPTEASVYTTYYIFKGNEKFLPIGIPLPNMSVYVLDEKMSPVPVGVKGELYISGVGLADGYMNNKTLSQKAFIKNEVFVDKLAYKTGDIVKLNEDKNIEYIGRQDSQIKIRGYRIELGEIESKIKEIACVQNCAVLVMGDDNQENLVAYLVSKSSNLSLEFILNEVKASLENSLPSYMIPKHYVKLDELPINSSGKVDRKSLKSLFNPGHFESEVYEELSFTEKNLLEIWKKCLGRSDIGINQSFFDLGGTSLKVIELYSLFVKDYELKINDIYKLKTIRKIAKKIKLKPQNLISHFRKINFDIDKCYNKLKDTPHSESLTINSLDTKSSDNFQSALLTGSTGYVGNFILRFLLEHTESNINLIIRGKNSNHVKDKIKNKLWYYHGIDIKKFESRINCLQGDISEPKLGLNDTDYLALNKMTDIVINCAAKVDHFGQYDEFYKANVASVKNLIDFCLLKSQISLHHISTLSVVKAKKPTPEGISILEEKAIDPSSIDEIENFYIKTKILSEILIEGARKVGLKSNIYRLGNVTFCKKTGVFQQNSNQNAFMRLIDSFIKLGLFPNDKRINFDLSYVDVVSRALGLLLCKSDTINRNYNIINPNKVSLSELATKITKLEPTVGISNISDFYEHLTSVYDSRHEPLITHLYSGEYWNKPSIVKNAYTQQVLEGLGHKWETFDSQDASNIIKIVWSMS